MNGNAKALPKSVTAVHTMYSLIKRGSEMTTWFGGRSALLKMAVLAAISLGAAGAHASDPLNQVNPSVGFSSVSKAYPDMDARYVRVGTEREIADVRRVAVGQSQPDLQAVLGRPALSHGDGSMEFHISLPLTQRDRLICQYRVFFDGENKVNRGVWRRPQCADLVLGARSGS